MGGLRAVGKKEKYEKIMEKKMATPIETLCKHFPSEFVTYLGYCRGLRFEDRPDYAYLRRLMKDLFCREQIQYDFIFDWTVLNYRAQQTSNPAPNLNPGQQAPAQGGAPGDEAKKKS